MSIACISSASSPTSAASTRARDLIARAVLLNPANARAQQNLGNAYQALGDAERASACFRRALELKPDLLEAHYNLGIAYRDLGRRDEAAACFRAALRLQPECAEAHYCLGHLACDEDRLEEAFACFREALRLRPEYLEARWSLALARIPQVYAAGEDPARCRAEFSAALQELERWFDDPARAAAGAAAVGAMQPFSLAYQEEPNRELLERYGRLCSRLMASCQRKGETPGRRTPGTHSEKIRLGIVSAHFHDHSVWHALVKGWFRELDRSRFALHALHLGTGEDGETFLARSRATHFEQGGRDLARWVEAIERSQPDVLIYPEVGMDPMTLKLASLRLAPVQAASWGHPETTGLPTIDYYLSAQDLEPPGAQANYSEKLVVLPHLGCCFEPRAVEPQEGVQVETDPDGALLVCPGVPYKYAPQHDWVLPQIAQRLGRCRFVFFTHTPAALSARLRERLRAAFAAQGLDMDRFVRFAPWLSKAAFQRLMRQADVCLDTIGFSGFNTALQAVECALPMVAKESRFLRGRLASGILRRIGLQELVVASEHEYVDRVVEIARDPGTRARLAAQIEANRPVLFGDRAPIRALEALLADVV
jgi:predicted O-linked N-acetylglucosamine transferase (SPINDLY family)